MALESGLYINSLIASNPTATDALAQADDHLRLIKSTLKNTFPNVTNVVNSTHSELNIIDGNTSATSTTLVDNDRVVVNDSGSMVQVALSDFLTYINAGVTLRSDVVTTTSITDSSVVTSKIADDAITSDKIANGAITSAAISGDVKFHSGMVMPYAGSSAPTGWLLCYGQEVSRTVYADLYVAIANTYGQGNGLTTFNIPDLRGRTVAGQDSMGGTTANRLTSPINGDTLGATGGVENITLTSAQSGLPAHNHAGSFPYVNIQSGTNSAKTGVLFSTHGSAGGGNQVPSSFGTQSVTINNNTTADAQQSHDNIQPTIILNYIIKV